MERLRILSMLLYSLVAESALAAALSAQLDRPIARHEERRFEDGEGKLRPLSDPRGDDAYVLLGLHGGPVDSPHDKLWRLLMFIATLREYGASQGRRKARQPDVRWRGGH
jgi:ribose-phosphate pyrophosphokinase